jgi:hypothetical protein
MTSLCTHTFADYITAGGFGAELARPPYVEWALGRWPRKGKSQVRCQPYRQQGLSARFYSFELAVVELTCYVGHSWRSAALSMAWFGCCDLQGDLGELLAGPAGPVEWAYVMSEVAAQGWRCLDIRSSEGEGGDQGSCQSHDVIGFHNKGTENCCKMFWMIK